jgi:putative hydrolase of the HAD superfamily
VVATIQALPEHPGLGGVTEAETREHWRRGLGLTGRQADELMTDFWCWYRGTLDQELYDWFVAQRPDRLTALLSNSNPGAREAERCWGFEEVTDEIVYSHEVGLLKPDPRIYALTGERLGVRPHEIVFLDDVEGHVAAARAAGWHAVVHKSTRESLRELERLLEEQALRP